MALVSQYSGRISIGYPSKVYYSWSSTNKWFDVVPEELPTGTKLAVVPKREFVQWTIESVKNIEAEDFEKWVKDSFGKSCTVNVLEGSLSDTLELKVIDEDPEANVMNSNCRGAFTNHRAVYHTKRKQLVWWDMGQEVIYSGPDRIYYDREIAASFHFDE